MLTHILLIAGYIGFNYVVKAVCNLLEEFRKGDANCLSFFRICDIIGPERHKMWLPSTQLLT